MNILILNTDTILYIYIASPYLNDYLMSEFAVSYCAYDEPILAYLQFSSGDESSQDRVHHEQDIIWMLYVQ